MDKIIKFEKEGCMPCKKLDKILSGLGVSPEHINLDLVENSDELIERYGIMSTPTLIKISGDKVEKLSGINHTTQEFKNFCEIE